MTKEKLFRMFYSTPNPHVNAFFEGPELSGEPHPLDVAREELEAEKVVEVAKGNEVLTDAD